MLKKTKTEDMAMAIFSKIYGIFMVALFAAMIICNFWGDEASAKASQVIFFFAAAVGPAVAFVFYEAVKALDQRFNKEARQ